MKVSTDAVLLGAWCNVEGAKRILDIGTGSGLIALMLAQRSESTTIDAVEISGDDANQARENVRQSPWPNKVHVIHQRIQDFTAEPYDLIVCNPPYFSRSLLPPNHARMRARHNAALSHAELISAARRFLMPQGKFNVILPAKEGEQFRYEAESAKLYLQKLTRFHSRIEKPQERSLMTYGATFTDITEDTLVLYERSRIKSEDYQLLTEEFYI